jgi:multiple sugar transport system permease protein
MGDRPEQIEVIRPSRGVTSAVERPGLSHTIFRLAEKRWLLPLPGFILLALVTFPPFFYALYLSLVNQDKEIKRPLAFVGLQNYMSVLGSSRGLHAFVETLLISLESTLLSLILGLGVALLIKRYTRTLSSWVLLLFILPMTVSPVVASLNFSLLLNPLYGPIDEVLYPFTHTMVAWTSTPFLATELIVAVQIWQWAPLAILLLYSGLCSLPDEPQEAARVDGANRLTLFWYITLPLLRPVITVSVIFEFILASLQFSPTELLTNGGPGYATEATSLYIYHIGIAETGAVSQAAAAGILMLILAVILATVWVRSTKWGKGTVV